MKRYYELDTEVYDADLFRRCGCGNSAEPEHVIHRRFEHTQEAVDAAREFVWTFQGTPEQFPRAHVRSRSPKRLGDSKLIFSVFRTREGVVEKAPEREKQAANS